MGKGRGRVPTIRAKQWLLDSIVDFWVSIKSRATYEKEFHRIYIYGYAYYR